MGNKKIDKDEDKKALNIQTRVKKVVCRLSNLGGILENLRPASKASYEVYNVDTIPMCSLYEQSVYLLGKVSVASKYP